MKNVLAIQSHVVYGFAGNKSATFPMQLLGVDVWALNTVQFSNHTQYGKWTGMVVPQEQIGEIANGLDAIGKLQECDDVLKAANALVAKGVKKVLVKHLGKAGKLNDPDTFEIIMATPEGVWHLNRPLYKFSFEPVGVGDLIAGTFLAHYLNCGNDVEAFEKMNNAVAGVMKTTFDLKSYELQPIAARFEILNPSTNYKAVKVA